VKIETTEHWVVVDAEEGSPYRGGVARRKIMRVRIQIEMTREELDTAICEYLKRRAGAPVPMFTPPVTGVARLQARTTSGDRWSAMQPTGGFALEYDVESD